MLYSLTHGNKHPIVLATNFVNYQIIEEPEMQKTMLTFHTPNNQLRLLERAELIYEPWVITIRFESKSIIDTAPHCLSLLQMA